MYEKKALNSNDQQYQQNE